MNIKHFQVVHIVSKARRKRFYLLNLHRFINQENVESSLHASDGRRHQKSKTSPIKWTNVLGKSAIFKWILRASRLNKT